MTAVPGTYFHVGMIVPELEPALEQLTRLFGYSWQDVVSHDSELYLPEAGGTRLVPMRLAISREEPFLEVIQAAEGTPWVVNEGSNLHHLGFWTDDLVADAAEVRAAACPMAVCRTGPSGDPTKPVSMSYHRGLGTYLELLDVINRPRFYGFPSSPAPEPDQPSSSPRERGMSENSYWHVGLVVEELEPALEKLTALFGFRWGEIGVSDAERYVAAERAHRRIALRYAMSLDAPFLEVVEAVEGTPWALNEDAGLHHLAFWAEDLPGAAAHMRSDLCPTLVCSTGPSNDPDDPASISYHRGLGVNFELVDVVHRPRFLGA
jgi:catechol 2,3-dioxygenase-like lactoylglutathione lyase family enzyme